MRTHAMHHSMAVGQVWARRGAPSTQPHPAAPTHQAHARFKLLLLLLLLQRGDVPVAPCTMLPTHPSCLPSAFQAQQADKPEGFL